VQLIHKELQTLDTQTYKDDTNLHKARSSQLLPLLTDIKESHEALSTVEVQTSSKEQYLLFNDSEK
jgi:hypothetical protein